MAVKSPYLHMMYNSNQDLIILDSLDSKIYRVAKEKADYIKRELNNPSEEMKHIFLAKGLYLDEECEYCEKLYEEYKSKKDFLNLIILPTEQCNFRCSYCYETHEKKIMNEELQNAIVMYVKKELPNYEALRVEWFGGEPLCTDNIIDFLSEQFIGICKKYKKPYYSSMTTNGYLLDLTMFRKMLKRNRIIKYQITLDGLESTHDEQRFLVNKQGTFNTIFNNLVNIKNNVGSKFFNIVIRCNITRDILNDFDEYVEVISNEFGGDPRFELLWKIAWNPEDSCNKRYIEPNGSYCIQDDLHICLEKYTDKILRFGTNKSQMMRYGNICYASNKNSIIIGSDGKLYKCTVAFDQEINHVGNLNLDGTLELDSDKIEYWTGRKNSMDIEKCGKCFLYPSCLGIYCNLNNENEKEEFICAGLKNYIDDYLQHISKIDYFVEDLV